MNGYVIVCKGKRYATNADNMMEAEDKLFNLLGEGCLDNSTRITKIDSLESFRNNPEIIFF